MKDLFKGYHAFFCTIGSFAILGQEEFVQAEYEYPMNFGRLAKEMDIPYFGILSNAIASMESDQMYSRVKG